MTNPFLQGIASGLHSYAQGGIIPAPSDTMPNNGYYPLSNIQQHNATYAPNLSFVQPSELLGSDDANIDPFTGEEKFDVGGAVAMGWGRAPVARFQPGFSDGPVSGGPNGQPQQIGPDEVFVEENWRPDPPLMNAPAGGPAMDQYEIPPQRNPMPPPDDPYGTGGYYNSNTGTDRGRRVGFGGGNEDRLREDALSGGIGPYVDYLNRSFAAAPRYKDNAGISWGGGPTGPTGPTRPYTGPFYPAPPTGDPPAPSGPTGPKRGPTGPSYPPPPPPEDDEDKKKKTALITPEVIPGSGTDPAGNPYPTGPTRGPTGPSYPPPPPPEDDEDDPEGNGESIEVIDPATGEYRLWNTKTGGYATTGPSYPTGPVTDRIRGGELVIDTNVDQTGNNTSSTDDGSYTGLTDDELALYGNNDDLITRGANDYLAITDPSYSGSSSGSSTGTAYNPNNTFANSNMTAGDLARLGDSGIGTNFGFDPNKQGSGWTYADLTRGGTSNGPSFKDNPLGWIKSGIASGLDYANNNKIETGFNVLGALSGIPGGSKLGTAGEAAIDAGKKLVANWDPNNALADNLIRENTNNMSSSDISKFLSGATDITGASNNDTGMTDEELALYGGNVATTSEDSTGSAEGAKTRGTSNPNWQFPGFSGYESPSLGKSQMGIGDMNAINFMTGSPTSMMSQGEMAAFNSLYGSGGQDVYAPGQTFASMNQDLADYAATHSIGSNDRFADDRAAYFAAHPELGADPGSTANYRSEIGEAEYADQTEREKSAEEQQQLDEHYSKLYGGEGMAAGGLASLPEYKAGGLLRGPGDGMSDSIPAVIKGQQPQRAALADGEFVVPADVVSHLGNGSTKAGSARLYEMMDKIRHARTGNSKQGKKINPHKFLPV